MHTPGHGVVNLAILGGATPPGLASAVLAGALIPDVPIMILYLVDRFLRGMPDDRIWAETYQRRFWQNLIHGMHSIPIGLAGLSVALALDWPAGAAFFGSALLHAALDFPIHAEDAHRHFYPLSDWRFQSPLSYWDPRHYGAHVSVVEMLAVAVSTAAIWRSDLHPAALGALIMVNAWYAFTFWRSFLRPATA